MIGTVKKVLVSLVLPTALLLVGGCGGSRMSEDFFQSYQVRSGTVLEIYNPNGEVTLTGWDQNTIDISAVKVSYHGQVNLDGVDIHIDIDDTMLIRTEHPEGDKKVTVSYDIKVPADIAVGMVECSSGDISLRNVNGNPVLSTSNGAITVEGTNGIVTAESSNGNISITGAKSIGDLLTSNGSIAAELQVLHDDLLVKTSNGSIEVNIEPGLEAFIKADTSNGSISTGSLNFESVEMERTSFSGALNGGGHVISLQTSNGSIALAPLK